MARVMRPDLGGEGTPIPSEEVRMTMVRGAYADLRGLPSPVLAPHGDVTTNDLGWVVNDDGTVQDPETGEEWPL